MMSPLRMTLIFSLVSLITVGCPRFNVSSIELKEDSVEPGKFTVAATVTAKYERHVCEIDARGKRVDKDCAEGTEQVRGRGILGVWLPESWSIANARFKESTQTSWFELEALPPETGQAFRGTFPYTPGRWSSFISPCTKVPEGVSQYIIELDIAGPEDEPDVMVGMILDYSETGFGETEEFTVNKDPIELQINLPSLSIQRLDPAQKETYLKSSLCEEVGEVDRGPRGCSCSKPGIRREHLSFPLIELLEMIQPRIHKVE